MSTVRDYVVTEWRPLALGSLVALLASIVSWVFFEQLMSEAAAVREVTVAEAIGVVGLGASAFAWWLRRSLEQQATRRLRAETDQAEARLRADTAIRAVQLMGEDASSAQKAGALLALASLQQIEFALELLRDLWPSGSIETGPALWVIEQGLDSDDVAIKRQAVDVFHNNAEKCLLSAGVLLPRQLAFGAWPADIGDRAIRHRLLLGFAKMAGAVQIPEAQEAIRGLVRMADGALADDDAMIRRDASYVAQTLIARADLPLTTTFSDADGEFWTAGGVLKRVEEVTKSEQRPTTAVIDALGSP